MSKAKSAEKVVQDIRRKTRRRFSAEEKIRIVLEGLRGEESIATLCRRGICLAGWFLDARDPIFWTCTFLGDLA